MGGGAVDIKLVKDIELKTKLPESPLPLLLACPGCLPAKLVAREGNQVEAVLVVGIVQRPQSRVVNILQGSFRCNVNNHKNLPFVLG